VHRHRRAGGPTRGDRQSVLERLVLSTEFTDCLALNSQL
jgi:hypothetical protein